MAFTADGLKFDHFMASGQFVFVYTCKKKDCYRKLFLRLKGQVCQFLRLTAKFVAILRLTTNPIIFKLSIKSQKFMTSLE